VTIQSCLPAKLRCWSNREQTARRENSRPGNRFFDWITLADREYKKKSGCALRYTQTLGRGACASTTRIRHDAQLEYRDVRKLNLIFLSGRAWSPVGPKFHCWRDNFPKRAPLLADERKTNSCVLAVSFSSRTREISFSLCGCRKSTELVGRRVLRRASARRSS
jgi:hypothetical protein